MAGQPEPCVVSVRATGSGRDVSLAVATAFRDAPLSAYNRPMRPPSATMLPVSMFRDIASLAPEGTPPARTTHPQASVRMAADETYERALRVTLQVLASP